MEEELIPFGTPQEQLATVNQAIYNIFGRGDSPTRLVQDG